MSEARALRLFANEWRLAGHCTEFVEDLMSVYVGAGVFRGILFARWTYVAPGVDGSWIVRDESWYANNAYADLEKALERADEIIRSWGE